MPFELFLQYVERLLLNILKQNKVLLTLQIYIREKITLSKKAPRNTLERART